MNQKPTIILTAVGVVLAFLLVKVLVQNTELRSKASEYEKLYSECIQAKQRIDTIIDTVYHSVYIPRPYPVVDSVVIKDTVIRDYQPVYRTYEDVIPYDEVEIKYSIGVWGTLEELALDYKLTRQVAHEIIYRDVPVEMPERLRVWLTATGGNKTAALGGLIGYKKVIGGYGYSPYGNHHLITVGYRLY